MPRVEARLPSHSNEVYRVRAGEMQYVVRLNRALAMPGVDHQLEREILGELGNPDFLPPLVYADDRCLVTGFIAGRPLSASESDLAELGKLFRNIHHATVQITVKLDLNAHIALYANQLDSKRDSLARCIASLMVTEPPSIALTLCHHDLLPANVIRSSAGLVALDWEYACLGDPAFDLAVLIESENLRPGHIDILLQAYGNTTLHFRERIDAMRPRYALVSLLWWMLQSPGLPTREASIAAMAERLGVAL